MLKRSPLEEREEAYLWIIYQAKGPNAWLSLPPQGKEHCFPKFMYDKLGTKPLGRVVVCYVPRRSSHHPEGLRVYPWPPVSDTDWHYHSSSIGFVYPNCFDEDFDEWSNIDDDNIGSPPPNSQPYRNLGVSPIVLQRIYLPPQDPSLGIIALHHSSTPWELGLTPRSRMWIDEFGCDLGQFGFYYILPHYWGKGRMWYTTKGKAKGKAYIQQPGQPEPQGMRAPLPGIPMYAPNKRGQIRAVYRNSDGRLVAFSSSGSEEEPVEGGSSNDEEPAAVAEQAEEESVAVAEEEPDSDDFSPWPPLPHEQVGLLTHERCAQTLTVYPRNAGTIPGAHGPISDPNGYPEALHEVRVPWNIFRHRFKFEVRRYGHNNIRLIVWRRDLHQVVQ